MSLARSVKPAWNRLLTPIAKGFLAIGLTPDAMTWIGSLLSIVAAIALFGTGHFVIGPLVLAVLVIFDTFDGLMSRISGTSSTWGAFLDSSLDRLSDAAIFGAISYFYLTRADASEIDRVTGVLALACIALGLTISYVKARGESLGATVDVGIAERTERLIAVLVGVFLVGLGLPDLVLTVVLALLVVACAVTIGQRMHAVYTQVDSPAGER